MKDGYSETEPATVPKARQAAEIWSRWGWVERCVWTERMLTALEKGVKGGKWFSLIDKVSALDNLQRAFAKVKANDGAAGADHQTIEMFEKDLTKNLAVLSQPTSPSKQRQKQHRSLKIRNDHSHLSWLTVTDTILPTDVITGPPRPLGGELLAES